MSAAKDEAPTPARLEPWGWAAYAVLAAFVLGIVYLGTRPGGSGPIRVYMEGRLALGLVALLLLAIGLVHATLRRPFLQRGRGRSFVILVVVFGLVNMPVPYPSSHEGHASSTCFRLPVAGEWTVFWGGEDSEANRLSSQLPDRRWGLDLVRVVDGSEHAGDGARLEDWYAFGEPVLAPAAGRVVRVVDDRPDVLPGGPTGGARPAGALEAPRGNLIVLETAPGEFCFLMHLRQGSARVAVGQAVEAGEPLAAVGCSGFSAFTPRPHLALHLQDTSEGLGEAIPWRFCDYLADGAPVERGLPRGGVAQDGRLVGQRVRPRE